uniref:Hormone-sensitive lipase n=1 Tax=Neogobius melanostomus TaxID=47308 RepID=A0A8C6T1I1_9GOBI
MDHKLVFSSLNEACEDTIAALCAPEEDLPYGEVAERLTTCMREIQRHATALEPIVTGLTNVYHLYDFDEETPGNGYRTLVKVLLSCLLHIIHKGRYISGNVGKAFFRADHNASEMEAYLSALCQLRALLHLAQTLLNDTPCGQLCKLQDAELSRWFVQEYSSMHKACFYGRCLGFQFSPSLRPVLQTVVISMVSYGETYGKQQSGIGKAALSILTSGKYVMDPELRGAEFERITQNLDLHFWKSFWNLTESGIITGFNRIASTPVQVNLTLSLPPVPLQLPLASDPSLTTNVSPPIAHWGPGPVLMRLISFEIREGQDSEELLSFCRTDTRPISMSQLPWVQKQPLSPNLLIHIHGGGFVAQTSKSHENYLRNWSKELGVPILSIDYSLSPEAPFPRALEECFYAYCWALKNCHLLGSTAERVCLAGDSAGGNLCITVCMKALTCGVRVPDGIMAAYPATLLTTNASPSRLLTSIDPLLPLGVLSKCMNAYSGMGSEAVVPSVGGGSFSALTRDTALLLSDLTQGASNWIQSFLDPRRTIDRSRTQPLPPRDAVAINSTAASAPLNHSVHLDSLVAYPEGFQPLRSQCRSVIQISSCPILKNPFVSPLLATEQLLKGLPPVHIVAPALDALLDDSVMFAKKLRAMGQPVTLTVVEELPHGFLSLAQLSKETEEAAGACVQKIREVFQGQHLNHGLQNPLEQEETQPNAGQ